MEMTTTTTSYAQPLSAAINFVMALRIARAGRLPGKTPGSEDLGVKLAEGGRCVTAGYLLRVYWLQSHRAGLPNPRLARHRRLNMKDGERQRERERNGWMTGVVVDVAAKDSFSAPHGANENSSSQQVKSLFFPPSNSALSAFGTSHKSC